MARVTFGKPARTQLVLCLPAANMAVVTFLHSARELIRSTGDAELAKKIANLTDELIDHSRAKQTPA